MVCQVKGEWEVDIGYLGQVCLKEDNLSMDWFRIYAKQVGGQVIKEKC